MSCVKKHNKDMTIEDVTMAADANTPMLPLPKRIVREISCQTDMIRIPPEFHHSSKYRL